MRVDHVFLTPQNQKNFGSCSTYGFCDMYYSHIYPNRLDDWYNGSNRISIWYLTKRDVIEKEWSYIICLKISDNDEYDFFSIFANSVNTDKHITRLKYVKIVHMIDIWPYYVWM